MGFVPPTAHIENVLDATLSPDRRMLAVLCRTATNTYARASYLHFYEVCTGCLQSTMTLPHGDRVIFNHDGLTVRVLSITDSTAFITIIDMES